MIKHPETFKAMTPAKFDGVFDWDFLLPAFEGTKIEPTDIDAVVERYGNFLVFETKTPDKVIEHGQEIMFENLLRLGRGRIHLIVLYGKSPKEIRRIEEWSLRKGKVEKKYENCNGNFLLQRVLEWFDWANKHPLFKPPYKGTE